MSNNIHFPIAVGTVFLLTVSCFPQTMFAETIQLVAPDGKPATDVRGFQSGIEPINSGGGGEDYGMGDMGMMMGGTDEMMGMGMGMGMEGMGGMEMGMGDMGMGMGEGSNNRNFRQAISFFNGKPLEQSAALETDDSGKLPVPSDLVYQLGRRKNAAAKCRASLLLMAEEGVSFVPTGTRLTSEVKLRPWQNLRVDKPKNVSADGFQVMTCWQNGFADRAMNKTIEGVSFSGNYDANDWRFKERFRWFQLSEFDQSVRVPPGEVRVTIVPKAKTFARMNAGQLLTELHSAGPTQVVVANQSSGGVLQVKFNELVSIAIKMNEQVSALPSWGDAKSPTDYLVFSDELKNHPMSNNDPFDQAAAMVDPFNSEPGSGAPRICTVKSNSEAVMYFNETRAIRATEQFRIAASASGDGQAIFGAIRPGTYQFMREYPDGGRQMLSVKPAGMMDGRLLFQVAEQDDDSRLVVPPLAASGTAPVPPASSALKSSSNRKLNDNAKLQAIGKLRQDLNATIQRLTQHLKQLDEIEAKLKVKQKPGRMGGLSNDPFGEF